MADYLLPVLLVCICLAAVKQRADLYGALTDGCSQGLRLLIKIIPSLVALLTAVHMLRASGILDALSDLASPALSLAGIPPELMPLMLVRPISGSAALAVFTDLIRTYGVDSRIGRAAAIMLGSTETTFYTVSIYFGAAGIRKSRYTIPAALAADFTGFVTACLAERIFFG